MYSQSMSCMGPDVRPRGIRKQEQTDTHRGDARHVKLITPYPCTHRIVLNGQRRRWCIQVHITCFVTPLALTLFGSYSLTVFSPSGKLVQIEHALGAVAQGTTSLGIKGSSPPSRFFHNRRLNNPAATNGVVIATEKKNSSILIDDSVIEKVAVICPNIGIVYSGMGPDFRVLVTKARKSAQAYWKIYGEYPPTKVLTQEIATVMQQATQSGYVRSQARCMGTHFHKL